MSSWQWSQHNFLNNSVRGQCVGDHTWWLWVWEGTETLQGEFFSRKIDRRLLSILLDSVVAEAVALNCKTSKIN